MYLNFLDIFNKDFQKITQKRSEKQNWGGGGGGKIFS